MKKMILRVVRSKRTQKLFRLIFLLSSKLPVKNNLVIFESFHGKQYSDSPKAIYEHMKKYHSANLVWSVDRRYTQLFEQWSIPYMVRFTPKWFFYFPRAKYWVNNVRFPKWFPKPKKTTYVQTWHGTPLKKLGVDIKDVKMPGTSTETYHNNFVSEAKKWDILVSPNSYSTEIFKSAFQYNGKIAETGYPRNDFLYNYSERDVQTVRNKLNIPKDKKVILYTPTWRDNNYYSVGRYKFDIQLNLDLMKDSLGENYVVLVRMHYLVADRIDKNKYGDFVIDVSKYPDISDLYIISDLLITDYSSTFFDFANLKRPILFFAYDLEEYKDELRGFYFDFLNQAPGPIVKTTEELIRKIKLLDEENPVNSEAFSKFHNKFCSLEDGTSAQKVAEAFYP
ncbi:CDP-glycerol glycerophosphotransferase family protein [Virgibacillus sp. MSP4-1]|nr:CDP-glycerol glycerophosphotransferase family protein [Virgibacillus sp. MSP4-1]QHS24532.1 CDP-glycerol glycerophosphotransferase family protein [Virgibacillus sp. MSP4-1]